MSLKNCVFSLKFAILYFQSVLSYLQLKLFEIFHEQTTLNSTSISKILIKIQFTFVEKSLKNDGTIFIGPHDNSTTAWTKNSALNYFNRKTFIYNSNNNNLSKPPQGKFLFFPIFWKLQQISRTTNKCQQAQHSICIFFYLSLSLSFPTLLASFVCPLTSLLNWLQGISARKRTKPKSDSLENKKQHLPSSNLNTKAALGGIADALEDTFQQTTNGEKKNN
jgi:hypothetical protein